VAHLLISAAHKSSGKTTVSLGLCAALRSLDLCVQPFKKGPDYIDPMWLGLASGRPCHNLDFYTQGHDEIRTAFARYDRDADLSLVEGNKGLYDGLDLDGSNSNAALAALLHSPVVLVIDCQGITRGIAPLILGYQGFEPKVDIAGVILNKVGGPRHESKLRAVLDHYTDVEVLGAIPKDPAMAILERHLGLVPSNEAQAARNKVDSIGRLVARHVDLQALRRIAESAPEIPLPTSPPASPRPADLRIGIARDAAFGFYYPGDLDALREAGAEPVFFDALRDRRLPAVDGLFIGGGFPEANMQALEANGDLRRELRGRIEAGLPTYAECGGLMYLARRIAWRGEQRDMVGVVPADVQMHDTPVGRGYTRLQETSHSPWPGALEGREFPAHEFHYSSLVGLPDTTRFAYRVLRGTGIDGAHDGIVHKHLLACYTHQRDVSNNRWAARFVDFVRRCRAAAHDSRPLSGSLQ
jgi:cobyrinic acid a,c-diamide synthase